VLFVNPGGPGFGASDLAAQADLIYDQPLLRAFDIIGIDPRGTGRSEPAIDCVDDYDPTFGIETGPDDDAENQALEAAATAFTAACVERSGALLQHVTTVDTAIDMDLVRRALGEATVSYFGWSYGTQLGATWATLFPSTVRAAVLDGAVDPTVGRVDGLVQQAAGFDASLTAFLADCSADPTCAFHSGGAAESAFADLLVEIETTVIPTSIGRPDLNQGVFEVGVAQALYSDSSWPQLARALADATDGDGSGMLALYDNYFGRYPDGSYGDELEAYFAITCGDDPAGDDRTAALAEAAADRSAFLVASPRIGTSAAYEVVICASFPTGANGAGTGGFEVTGAGAGEIVVVGNTGDPATPFEGSRRMADTLERGVFVAVEADQHTAYGLNRCIDGTIDRYLVDLAVPEPGLTC
jgi:pimeloyl-ACP methyl ester carboxylesterase